MRNGRQCRAGSVARVGSSAGTALFPAAADQLRLIPPRWGSEVDSFLGNHSGHTGGRRRAARSQYRRWGRGGGGEEAEKEEVGGSGSGEVDEILNFNAKLLAMQPTSLSGFHSSLIRIISHSDFTNLGDIRGNDAE